MSLQDLIINKMNENRELNQSRNNCSPFFMNNMKYNEKDYLNDSYGRTPFLSFKNQSESIIRMQDSNYNKSPNINIFKSSSIKNIFENEVSCEHRQTYKEFNYFPPFALENSSRIKGCSFTSEQTLLNSFNLIKKVNEIKFKIVEVALFPNTRISFPANKPLSSIPISDLNKEEIEKGDTVKNTCLEQKTFAVNLEESQKNVNSTSTLCLLDNIRTKRKYKKRQIKSKKKNVREKISKMKKRCLNTILNEKESTILNPLLNEKTFEISAPLSSHDKDDNKIIEKPNNRAIIPNSSQLEPIQKVDKICEEKICKTPLKLVIKENNPYIQFQDTLKEYFCKICSKMFTCRQSLGGHMSRRHPGESIDYQTKLKLRNLRKNERELLYLTKRKYYGQIGLDYDELVSSKEGKKKLKEYLDRGILKKVKEEFIQKRNTQNEGTSINN